MTFQKVKLRSVRGGNVLALRQVRQIYRNEARMEQVNGKSYIGDLGDLLIDQLSCLRGVRHIRVDV